jgi:hypothetical protein
MASSPLSPHDWKNSEVVMVESDALDNISAIRDIDEWALAHGFKRIPEYWLRRARRDDGTMVFRGVCEKVHQDRLAESA